MNEEKTNIEQPVSTEARRNSILPVLIIVLVIVLLGSVAYYFFSIRQSNTENSPSVTNTEVTSGSSANTSTNKTKETKSGDSSETAGSEVDFDAETNAMDESVNSIKTEDFADSTLSDSELGI